MNIKVTINPSLQKLGGAVNDVNIQNFLRAQITAIGYKVQRMAKQLAPVRTGLMRSTIGVGTMINSLGAIVQTNVDYAIFVHEGTRFMRGRPFMEWGAEAARLNLEGELTSKLNTEFVQAFKKL